MLAFDQHDVPARRRKGSDERHAGLPAADDGRLGVNLYHTAFTWMMKRSTYATPMWWGAVSVPSSLTARSFPYRRMVCLFTGTT